MRRSGSPLPNRVPHCRSLGMKAQRRARARGVREFDSGTVRSGLRPPVNLEAGPATCRTCRRARGPKSLRESSISGARTFPSVSCASGSGRSEPGGSGRPASHSGAVPRRGPEAVGLRLPALPRLRLEDILQPQLEVLLDRMLGLRRVLLMHDTTTPNLNSTRPVIKGRVPIEARASASRRGCRCMPSWTAHRKAACPTWRAWRCGLVSLQGSKPGTDAVGSLRGCDWACALGRHRLGTAVVKVCDREADKWALFRL